MTEAEFIKANSRLENYYDKDYTQNQQKEMFNFFKGWSLEKYVKAINYCLKTSKYLPKIADLMNANIDNMQVQNKEKIDFVKCDKCNGEGFIKYWKTIQNGGKPIQYEYIALCTCDNADKQRSINGHKLPTLAEVGL